MRLGPSAAPLLVTAVAGLGIAAAIAGRIMATPATLPEPSRGRPVTANCPPAESGDYYFPAGLLVPRNRADDQQSRTWLSGHLRAAGAPPLWCGDRTDTAYRFSLLFEWGRTKVITIQRAGVGWMLDGSEFKHPSNGRYAVDRHVSRPLSQEEIALVTATVAADGFWRLAIDEPIDDCCYDGPAWFMEGRSMLGYHHVMRAWSRKEILRTARLFMQLAGFRGEQNTGPGQ